MNLLSFLRERIEALPDGDYTHGLKSVLQHVEVATRHLERGQSALDDTAFTDAIYRTNQAFEGSLKEAFRVLAGKDPNRVRPFDIEEYFQKSGALRPRVLAQFTNYRQEWRNPSAHDYRLDFDGDEALLAIVTVTAFAIVLTDQIAERLAFQHAQIAATTVQAPPPPPTLPLLQRSTELIAQFTANFRPGHKGTDLRETEILGALAGFLATTAPDVTAQIDGRLLPDHPERPDLILASPSERVIVEIKRMRKRTSNLEREALSQVLQYILMGAIKQAIVFLFCSPNTGEVSCRTERIPGLNAEIVIIAAESPTD
jgi:hypothetical protein